jgi:8-oxo-dGTP pyrophosphatase MutT (NUDIX family)
MPRRWSVTSISNRTDFSAGGVVVRGDQVIVIVPAKSRATNVLALPKGHPDGDESPLEAAVREVREETGVEAAPIEKLGEIEYTYERKRGPVDKRVAFWLFEYRSGELNPDHEIAEARWMPLDRAAESLTYEGEREMVRRALSRHVRDR